MTNGETNGETNDITVFSDPTIGTSDALSFVGRIQVHDPRDIHALQVEEESVKYISEHINEYIGSFKVRSQNEGQRLRNAAHEDFFWRKCIISIHNDGLKEFGLSGVDSKSNLARTLQTAAALKMYESIGDMKTIMNAHFKSTRELDIVAFYNGGGMLAKLSDKNLNELFQESTTDREVVTYLLNGWDFLLSPYVTGTGELAFEPFIQQTDEQLFTEYPNMAMSRVLQAALFSQAMIDVDKEELHGLAELSESMRPLVKEAESYVKKLDEHRERAYTSIFKNTKSKKKEQLLEVFLPAMQTDYMKIRALRVFNVFKDADHVIGAYRWAQSQDDVELGVALCQGITEYIDACGIENMPGSLSDFSFLTENRYSDEHDLDLSTLRSISTKIATLRQKDLRFDFEGNIFRGLESEYIPDSAHLSIDSVQPTRFSLDIVWKDPLENEDMHISVFVDTKKLTVNWSLLEDPSHGNSEQLRRYILRFCETAMQNALEQAQHRSVSTEEELPMTTPSLGPKIKKQHFRDPIFDLKKHSKRPVHTTSELQMLPQSKDVVLALKELVNNQFILPGGQNLYDLVHPDITAMSTERQEEDITNAFLLAKLSLEKVLKSIETEIHDKIIAALCEYQATGKGRFKKLEHPGTDGEHHYSLRVNTPNGAVRIIFKKIGSNDKGDLFQIEKIDKRSRVYASVFGRK